MSTDGNHQLREVFRSGNTRVNFPGVQLVNPELEGAKPKLSKFPSHT